jgi:hypothetical protein
VPFFIVIALTLRIWAKSTLNLALLKSVSP